MELEGGRWGEGGGRREEGGGFSACMSKVLGLENARPGLSVNRGMAHNGMFLFLFF